MERAIYAMYVVKLHELKVPFDKIPVFADYLVSDWICQLEDKTLFQDTQEFLEIVGDLCEENAQEEIAAIRNELNEYFMDEFMEKEKVQEVITDEWEPSKKELQPFVDAMVDNFLDEEMTINEIVDEQAEEFYNFYKKEETEW